MYRFRYNQVYEYDTIAYLQKMIRANILIVDDDRDVLETARIILKQEFSRIDVLSDPSSLPAQFSRQPYDIVLLDMNFRKGLNDGREGLYWLERILEMDPEAVVILITAYADVDLAVTAIKHGATDFIMKPWKNQKLIATLHAAMKLGESRKKIRHMENAQQQAQENSDRPFMSFIGSSPPVERVRDLITKVADTDANVLILGENGTGKELVARSIHRQSSRRDKIFMGVDLGAVPPSLLESELFGHVKGAFTDAGENRQGKIQAADGGTLFLDELGNISLEAQMKLLRTLQTREVTPLGKTQGVEVDFRLVSATNMPVYKMVDEQKFRSDLLYRINTVEIILPPLRDRGEDILQLAEHFLSVFSEKYGKPGLSLSGSSQSALLSYRWPGNIRELQHAVERAVILTDSGEIHPSDLFPQERPDETTNGILTLEEKEKEYIREVLNRNEGNVTQTARILGLTRTALYRRLNKYGLL